MAPREMFSASIADELTRLFDREYYLRTYPDVALSGLDPVHHYLLLGAPRGLNPHPLFDTSYYTSRYPDVSASGMNPLLHYLQLGAEEGRSPHPLLANCSPGVDGYRAVANNREIPASLRARLLPDILRLISCPPGSLPNPITLFGFAIHYSREEYLRYLISEIFINNSYYFTTDVTNPLIIDCGSNIGVSILYFSKIYPEATILGFEPDPYTFSVLAKNLEENSLGNVEAHQAALVRRGQKEASFFVDADKPGRLCMSLLKCRGGNQELTVKGQALSSLIRSEVDLVKMDIEGGEYDVIKDLCEQEKIRFVKQFIIEYHHNIDGSSYEMSDFLAMFEKHNFSYSIRTSNDRLSGKKPFQDILLCCHRSLS